MKIIATIPQKSKYSKGSVQNDEHTCQKYFLITKPVDLDKENNTIMKVKQSPKSRKQSFKDQFCLIVGIESPKSVLFG